MLDQLFDRLWQDYAALVPSAEAIYDALAERGESPRNDHVAFRTFDLPGIDIEALTAPLLAAGYERSGSYDFATKRLDAISLSHAEHPRVFVSQLRTAELSPTVQKVAEHARRQVEQSGVAGIELLTCAPSWEPVAHRTYEALVSESEYAGWLSVFGLRANHFTIAVNDLTTFDKDKPLHALCDWLQSRGFALNASGGVVKGRPEQLLEQASTLADKTEITFGDGEVATIPSCYVEFALRHHDPTSGELFDGFVTGNADRIFESTDRR